MAITTPRPPANAGARQVLELLRKSWMLALRADGKSQKTLDTLYWSRTWLLVLTWVFMLPAGIR